jgi:hypothetical protein
MYASLAPVRRPAGVCVSRGRPGLWYGPGDLVSVGGIDGVYVRRVPGSRGHAHFIQVADLPAHGPTRRSNILAVWGCVEVLQPVQLSLF